MPGKRQPRPSSFQRITQALLTAPNSTFIAKGSEARVYKQIWRDKPVAVKVVHTNMLDVFCTRKATAALERLKHPNLVTHYGYGIHGKEGDDNLFFFVSAWMPNGTLYDFVRNATTISLPDQLELMHGAAAGLAAIHGIDYLHADYKSANCLLDENNVVKVADFGFAAPVSVHAKAQYKCGSDMYVDPRLMELFSSAFNDVEADVYSLAVVLWEVTTVQIAPENDWRFAENKPVPESCPPGLASLITRGCHRDISKRPTAKQIEDNLDQQLKAITRPTG